MRPITHIILHHSAYKDSNGLEFDDLKRMHLSKGWADIGYNYVIEWVDGHYIIIVGRPLDMDGAHCPGFNSKSIGICVNGNFHTDEVPQQLYDVVVQLIKSLQVQYMIPRDHILGHREAMPGHTVCPGQHWNLDQLRLDCFR